MVSSSRSVQARGLVVKALQVPMAWPCWATGAARTPRIWLARADGLGVVAVVLGDPPVEAHPDQQVGVDQADRAPNPFG